MYKFVAKCHACINVVLGNGANVHVSFTELTGGKSVYYTSDEAIASAMRSHSRFGKLFKEEVVPVAVQPVSQAKQAEEEAGEKVKAMSFSCNDDAKDYLADKFGVSRSKMRSRSSIETIAQANGIQIKWTDGE